MVASNAQDVEVLNQNREPLTRGRLEVSGRTGYLKPEQALPRGMYFVRFGDGRIMTVGSGDPEQDGRLPVQSRDYPYDMSAS